jgi:hypothetical protein
VKSTSTAAGKVVKAYLHDEVHEAVGFLEEMVRQQRRGGVAVGVGDGAVVRRQDLRSRVPPVRQVAAEGGRAPMGVFRARAVAALFLPCAPVSEGFFQSTWQEGQLCTTHLLFVRQHDAAPRVTPRECHEVRLEQVEEVVG